MSKNILLEISSKSAPLSSGHIRPRQGTDICNLGAPPPLDFFQGRSFLLTGKSFYLRLVFVAYGQLAWSFFYLRLKFGWVFSAYGRKSVWSFLLTVPPCPEIRFGLFLLTVPPSGNWVCFFFAYGSPTVSKKDEP